MVRFNREWTNIIHRDIARKRWISILRWVRSLTKKKANNSLPYALSMDDIFLTWCPLPEKFSIVEEHMTEVIVLVFSKLNLLAFSKLTDAAPIEYEREIIKMKSFYYTNPKDLVDVDVQSFGYSIKTNTIFMTKREKMIHA